MEAGYELSTDPSLTNHYYSEAYTRWNKRYTLPMLSPSYILMDGEPNHSLRMVKSVNLLRLDLLVEEVPIYEDKTFMELICMVDILETVERLYISSTLDNVSLDQDFWTETKGLCIDIQQPRF